MAQVVECLPSKCKVLISICNTAKKQKQNKTVLEVWLRCYSTCFVSVKS
jgi:hypothetical protein